MNNPFFKNKGPIKINDILISANINNKHKYVETNILDIKDLVTASNTDITFFHSKKYEAVASITKAAYCLTTKQLSTILPNSCKPIEVDNVLISTAIITKIFYPDSVTDDFDPQTENIEKTILHKTVKHGQNVLVGKNVKIGLNSSIGHNSIIESNVIIGDNCSIGSNVIIRNTLIKNNVYILDGCVIGKKGFGFFPNKNGNTRYPHIGIVIIEDNCEIGCGSTIDRGSLSNTVIGKNTFIDNQVHIAHNNKIGENCIIAGQVGFAGSSTLGNNVMIGGQAGISGHLKIGNNVQIGGGSGVIKNIPDNTKQMGYPAKDLKKFIKDNK
ncbi:UDP-3-O-(3-hydroxymyristoyl)glucosamine N-acyltransferase [Candidatus Pelagibacter ubique]|nr:UDP-3-O-(3-hydroxymyristoyl)glucosamine N-acyltransferase [Candidatus Pelagibacter ubique]